MKFSANLPLCSIVSKSILSINVIKLQKGVDKGELLFSLQFLPTSCRLTVAVLKARGLGLQGEDNDLGEEIKGR